MALKEKFPSVKLNTSIPAFFMQDGEALYNFIKLYYKWLEQYEHPVYVARRLKEYTSVDLIPQKFFSFLRNEFMKHIPQGGLANENTLLKNIKEFYRSRGSEKSIKLLFRILFNEEIDITYPSQHILRASDGHWIVERSLKVNCSNSSAIFASSDAELDLITGVTSNAQAAVDHVIQYYDGGLPICEYYISGIVGNFIKGEVIMDAVANMAMGFLTSNGVLIHPGYYSGSYGFLSSDQVLEDNYYYQDFSYVIESTKSLIQYQDAIQSLVHPAGTLMFGNIRILPDIDSTFEFTTTAFNFFEETDISIDFSLNAVTSVLSSAIASQYEFDIPLQMYIYNHWMYEQTPGLGKVSIILSNNNLLYIRNDPLVWYRNIPLNLIGTRYVLKGDANTSFLTELANGSVLYAYLNGNTSNTFYDTIQAVSYSNVALLTHLQTQDRLAYNYKYDKGQSNFIVLMQIR